MMNKRLLCTFAFLLIGVPALFSQATLISQFDFNDNLTDNEGNATCTQHDIDGSWYDAGIFNWYGDSSGNTPGLRVVIPDAVFTEDNYSIAIAFKFTETTGYRKVIDFSGLSVDNGVYVNSQLRLYISGNYGPTTIPGDSLIHLLITRNAANDSTKLYLWNGVNLQQESVALDATNAFVASLSGADREFYFFADDNLTSTEYSRYGSVDQIRIWNGIVDESDVLSTTDLSPVAEFTCAPNPTTDQATITFKTPASGIVSVIAADGKVVRTVDILQQTEVELPLQDVNPGIYYVRYAGKTIKLVKE